MKERARKRRGPGIFPTACAGWNREVGESGKWLSSIEDNEGQTLRAGGREGEDHFPKGQMG